MPKFIDLTGQKYQMLTVIEKAENIKGRVAWRCRCDCGGETVVTSNVLREGKTKSCGCLSKKSVQRGEKYGKLTVCGYIGSRGNNKYWDCVCECGNHTDAYTNLLRFGHKTSCGCANQAVENLVGKRFGRLTVLEFYRTHNKRSYWYCRCDCGNEKIVGAPGMKGGHIVSCGCYGAEASRAALAKARINPYVKHGLSRSRIYNIYGGIKERCYNPNDTAYRHYGGRGIKMCDEWLEDFMNFYEWAMANGYEDHLSIDRIDVNGNYCPENCRWATHKEQSNNKQYHRWLTYEGETHNLTEWANIVGMDPRTLNARIRSGWSVAKALTEPVMKQYSRHKT